MSSLHHNTCKNCGHTWRSKSTTSSCPKRCRKTKPTLKDSFTERLVSVAIIRGEKVESRGFKSHAELRRALGDENAYMRKPGDDEGFLTSKGRFVRRWEAATIGFQAGQVRRADLELLSSEVTW